MGSVLVTGCTGLLGANACYVLRESDDVVALSRSPFAMRGVGHVRASFEDLDAVARILDERDVDRVIHCAALTDVDYCERHPEEAMRVNCSAVVELARLAARHGARFAFVSSDAVFSGEKDGAYAEGDETCPVNVYGEAKARAEEGVLALPGTLVVRTNLYGINYSDKLSFGEWVLDSLSAGRELTMFRDVVFSPLVADELARAIAAAVSLGATGVLNVSSTGGISKYDFGVYLKGRMGLEGSITPVSVEDFDFAARRSHNMRLDNSRATALLGRNLPTPEEGIDSFISQYSGGYRDRLREGVS